MNKFLSFCFDLIFLLTDSHFLVGCRIFKQFSNCYAIVMQYKHI